MLLEAGCSLHDKPHYKGTILLYALENQHYCHTTIILEKLTDLGCSWTTLTTEHLDLFNHTIYKCNYHTTLNITVLKYLLTKSDGLKIKHQGDYVINCFFKAKVKEPMIFEFLINLGADVHLIWGFMDIVDKVLIPS